MAMEPVGGMSRYASFSGAAPVWASNAGERRRQLEREAILEEREQREALVSKASTVNQIAQLIVDQNEKMIAGLRSTTKPEPSEPVDYIARNAAAVGPNRGTKSRKEQALLARAEVMAAATRFVGEADAASSRPTPIRARQKPAQPPADCSDDLVRAAREEIERGLDISAFETQTRRRPRLPGLGSSQKSP